MSKVFGEGVAVYTKDSVTTTDDDERRQAIVDEWTDKLAQNMAEHTHMVMLDDGTVLFDTRQRRGGHNKQTIEVVAYRFPVQTQIPRRTLSFYPIGNQTVCQRAQHKRAIRLPP